MVMMMSWLCGLCNALYEGAINVYVLLPQSRQQPKMRSPHTVECRLLQHDPKKTSKQVGSCAIFYIRRIFFLLPGP